MKKRTAFTLFEVLLVCAVLVIVAALCYPSMRSMQSGYKIEGAIDSVRGAWARARERAIEENRPYRFSIEPDGKRYRLAPDLAEFWDGGSGEGAVVVESSLPDGVRFTLDENAPPVTDSGSASQGSSVSWAKVVVFQPDGTSQEDVRILFQVQGARSRQVHLRGATGHVSVQTMSQ